MPKRRMKGNKSMRAAMARGKTTTSVDPFREEKARALEEQERDRRRALESIAQREAVNHPPHYNQGNIEVIDAIEDWGLDFNAGNVIKYVARHKHKAEPLEDLKKARWYLDRIIKGIENGSN